MNTAGRPNVAVEDQRPALIRTYGLVAWVTFTLFSIAAGLIYRRVAVGRLTYELEGQVFAVTQRFATATWPDVRRFASDAAELDPAALRAAEEVAEIGSQLATLTADLPVVELKVTAEDGTVLYATQADQIGTVAVDPVTLELIAGRRYGLGRADAVTERDGTRVTTYAGIRSNLRQIEAVVEIDQDAAPAIRRIARTQAIGMGGGAGLSAIFLVAALAPRQSPSGRKESTR